MLEGTEVLDRLSFRLEAGGMLEGRGRGGIKAEYRWHETLHAGFDGGIDERKLAYQVCSCGGADDNLLPLKCSNE